jgi:hypothetical protein
MKPHSRHSDTFLDNMVEEGGKAATVHTCAREVPVGILTGVRQVSLGFFILYEFCV